MTTAAATATRKLVTDSCRSATGAARLASHWKDHCLNRPVQPEAPRKPLAGNQCIQCKDGGHYCPADCPAKARANFTQAEVIAAVAAEFGKQYEAEWQAAETADWRNRPV